MTTYTIQELGEHTYGKYMVTISEENSSYAPIYFNTRKEAEKFVESQESNDRI